MASPLERGDQSAHVVEAVPQAGSGGHRIRSTYWRGPVGFVECECNRVTEVYEGGWVECRFARLEADYTARLTALRFEFDVRLRTAEAASSSDGAEWRRVQRKRRPAAS